MTGPSEDTVLDALIHRIRISARTARGLAIPVSGGSDGALCFWLCVKAFPEKTRAIHFGSSLRARTWFEQTGRVEYLELPQSNWDQEALRWAGVASYCLEHDCWPVGSRNRTEEILRTYSRPSVLATMLPICGLWKTSVMRLCEHIGVPEEILASSRQADPVCGRPEELSAIGIERVDNFLRAKLGLPTTASSPLNELERRYLEDLIQFNEFKAFLPHQGALINI